MKEKQEYNTFLLKLNIDNIQENYERLKKDVTFLLLDSDYAILRQLKLNYTFQDKIDFNNIDIQDFKEYLKEFKQEYVDIN